jgi:hypothetical protein
MAATRMALAYDAAGNEVWYSSLDQWLVSDLQDGRRTSCQPKAELCNLSFNFPSAGQNLLEQLCADPLLCGLGLSVVHIVELTDLAGSAIPEVTRAGINTAATSVSVRAVPFISDSKRNEGCVIGDDALL